MLFEQFESCVSEQIVLHLNEKNVTTLQQAKVLLQKFALTYKSICVSKCERSNCEHT